MVPATGRSPFNTTHLQVTMASFFEEALISEVEKYRVLYDLSDRLYYDAQARDNAWQEISERLKTDAEDCKKKWKGLRESLRKAKLRRKKVSGQEVKHWNPWKYEKEMSFLDIWKDTKGQKLPNDPLALEDTEDGNSVVNDDESQTTTFLTHDSSTTYSECGSSIEHLPNTKRQMKQEISIEVSQQYFDMKEEKRDLRESTQSMDDHIRQFFASSEAIFRMLPAEVQIDARVEITQLLAKYEKQELLKHVHLHSPSGKQ